MNIITIDDTWEQVPVTNIHQAEEGWAFRLDSGRAMRIQYVEGLGLRPLYGGDIGNDWFGIDPSNGLLKAGLATIWRPKPSILDHDAFKDWERRIACLALEDAFGTTIAKVGEGRDMWIKTPAGSWEPLGDIGSGEEQAFADLAQAVKRIHDRRNPS